MNNEKSVSIHYLTRKEAARYIAKVIGRPMSHMTLATLASKGGGPLYCKIGRQTFYEIEDLVAWVDAHRTRKYKSTSDEWANKALPS